MALKKFKVHYRSDDGIEDYFEVESLDEETLRNEFASLHMGTILDAHEIGAKGSVKNKVINTVTELSQKQYIIPQSEESWTMLTLQNGNVIKVSNRGRVQERFWEDIDLSNPAIINEFGIRFIKANSPEIIETKLPENIKAQRAVWKIMENNSIK